MSLKKDVDVLVIGAGPSGTIAAALLHKAGLTVQVVEKAKFPRFVIGESLLPRCMEALDEAGLIEAVASRGFQKKVGAKFVKGNDVCSFSFNQQFTQGWDWTWQVPRAEFDKALADECARKGTSISYETEVTGVSIEENGHSVTEVLQHNGKVSQIKAKFIVDGSGYGRVLPKLFGLEQPSAQQARKTVFCHIEDLKRDAAEEPNRITVYVQSEKVWIWCIPFSNGNTSVGFVADPSYFEQFEGNNIAVFRALLASEPQLADRFKGAKLMWAPRDMQGWSATTDTFFGKGFVLTGNVTEFLDPIFSSGVTLAAVSAQKAAALVVRHLKGEPVDWQSEYTDVMLQGVDVFRTFVNRWYDGTLFKILFAGEQSPELMSQICSVLAGYVWDQNNPVVRQHDKIIRTLAKYLETQNDKPGA